MTPDKLKSDEAYMAQFIKVKEAADILNVTRNTVYNRVKAGKLNTVPICVGTSAEEALFYREQVEALVE